MKTTLSLFSSGPKGRRLAAGYSIAVVLALAASIFIGLRAKGVAQFIAPAGSIYLLLLEMTIIPILISAMIAGISRLVERPGFPRRVAKLLGAFLLIAALVGAIGAAAGGIGRPGAGLDSHDQALLSAIVGASPQSSELSVSLSGPAPTPARATLLGIITGIVPRNPFASLSEGRILQIVLFSFLLGLAIGLLREKQRDLLVRLAEGGIRAFSLINRWLVYALPVGLVCLLSSQIAAVSVQVLLPMLRFVVVFLAASAACVLVTTLVIWARSGRHPLRVLRALVAPSAYAFMTGNSLVAIPYALRSLTRWLRFRRDGAYFAQPVLSAAGSYGNMLFFVLAAIFIAQFYGSPLGASAYAVLFISAAAAAVGSSGKQGAASVAILPLVLIPLGLPVETGVALFGALSVIIGPVRALVDVNAAMAAAALSTARAVPARRRAFAMERALAPQKRISIRASLIVLVGALIVLTGGVIAGVLYSGERKSIYILADSMIQEISARAEQRTLNYFSPAERSVRRMSSLLQQNIVSVNDHTELLAALRGEIQNNPEFAAAYFADTRGNFYMVKRMADGSLSNRIITRLSNRVVVHWDHANPAYRSSFPDSSDSLATGYDPRTRVWYEDAVKADDLIWTDVYLFASDNMLGISDAIPIHDARGRLDGVLAVDIGLAQLSSFLGTLEVSQSGRAFILNNKSEVIALSVSKGGNLSELFSGGVAASGAVSPANLVLADESSDPLVRDSYLASLRTQQKNSFFSFTSKHTRYLSMFTAFPPNRYFNWTIGIAIPEELVMGQVNQTNRVVLYAAILIIIVAIGLGINFSRAITFPLSRLSHEMERIRNFDLQGDERMDSRISEIHNMNEAFTNMKHGLRAFNKYVPSKLVAQLLELGEEPELGGQAKELTILFSDIKGFTTISEHLAPQKLIGEMAGYFTALSNIIMKSGGTVDKYIGDAIMAFWNAPADTPNHALNACLAALEIRRVLASFAKDRPRGDASIFHTVTRIGLHTGEVVVGNMGSSERLNYTVIGDGVNLASRLEGLNKYYGTDLLASETTIHQTGGAVVGRLVDRVAVKGRTGGIEIFELVDTPERLSPSTLQFVRRATEVVRLYLERRFAEARVLADELLAHKPDDVPLSIIAERCAEFMRQAPPGDWKGVFVHHEK